MNEFSASIVDDDSYSALHKRGRNQIITFSDALVLQILLVEEPLPQGEGKIITAYTLFLRTFKTLANVGPRNGDGARTQM